jgi:hypothetical protein
MTLLGRLPRLSKERQYNAIAAILCLAAWALYNYRLDFWPLWWDEGISVYTAYLPLSNLLQTVVNEDVHPPGYYLILYGWIKLVGASPFSARILSAFAAILTISLLYKSGQILKNRPAGLLVALIGALSPFILYYAQEIRMYSLGILLTALSTYAFIRLVKGTSQPLPWWILYIASVSLGMHIQYAFIVIPAAQLSAAVIMRRQQAKQWLAAGALLAALFLPWLLYARSQLVTLQANRLDDQIELQAGREAWTAVQYLTMGYAQAGTWLETAATAVFLALALLGLWGLLKNNRVTAVFATLAILGAIFAALAVRYTPEEGLMRGMRLTFAAAPLLIILAGVGGGGLLARQRWLGGGAIALFVVSLAFNAAAVYREEINQQADYRPLIAEIRTLYRDNDGVLNAYTWQDGYFYSYAPNMSQAVAFERKEYAAVEVPAFVESLLTNHSRLWVVNHRADINDASYPFNLWLRQEATLVFDQWFGDTQLALFTRRLEPPPTEPGRTALANNILLEYAPVSTGVAAGGLLHLHFRWQRPPQEESGYQLFIHVGGVESAPIAQYDRPLFNDFAPPEAAAKWEHYAILIPIDTPPGDYQIYVGLYEPASGNRLEVASPVGCDDSDRICLGYVTIRP